MGDGGDPGLDAGVGLVILIDVIKGQADKLAVNYSLGIIKGVTVGLYATDELGTAILDTVVEFAHAAYESIAIR